MTNYRGKHRKKHYLFFSILFSLAYILQGTIVYAKAYDKEEFKQVMEGIYTSRCSALVSGDSSNLKQFYDVSQKYGQWALEHEIKRIHYVKH